MNPSLPQFEGKSRETAGRGQAAPDRAKPAVSLPLCVRSDEDLATLIRWFRVLCANAALREQFLAGTIDLEPRLAAAATVAVAVTAERTAAAPTTLTIPPGRVTPADASGTPRRAADGTLDESVVTDAVLRRHGGRGLVLRLRPGAVITPSARDYARSADIRLDRGQP